MTPLLLHGAPVIHLRGSLATTEAPWSGRLSAAVAELADAGWPRVGVDLARVTAIDARGLGALVLALRAARDRGARLVLVAPPPRVRRVLAITRLDTVFDVVESFGPFGPFGSFGSFEPRTTTSAS